MVTSIVDPKELVEFIEFFKRNNKTPDTMPPDVAYDYARAYQDAADPLSFEVFKGAMQKITLIMPRENRSQEEAIIVMACYFDHLKHYKQKIFQRASHEIERKLKRFPLIADFVEFCDEEMYKEGQFRSKLRLHTEKELMNYNIKQGVMK